MLTKITGKSAVKILASLSSRIDIYKKDNTDKFWCYKVKSGKKREFAFDPSTKTTLNIRTEIEPPLTTSGISKVESLKGKNVSTALQRVFSGDMHAANFKSTITSEEGLIALIEHMEKT